MAALTGIAGSLPAAASEIKYVVNNTAITSYDIQKRAAFLKLQHRPGASTKLAAQDMIEQALKSDEMAKRRINIPKAAVDASFAKFAARTRCRRSSSGILDQAGVTASHFKEYIRVQMGWGQLVAARYRAESGGVTEQDAVRRMLDQGGAKPSATEYLLQQVIFVVPASDKGKLGQRKREAEAMRARFTSCETTRQFAKGLIDVTVRDLPRARLAAPGRMGRHDQGDLARRGDQGSRNRTRRRIHRHLLSTRGLR